MREPFSHPTYNGSYSLFVFLLSYAHRKHLNSALFAQKCGASISWECLKISHKKAVLPRLKARHFPETDLLLMLVAQGRVHPRSSVNKWAQLHFLTTSTVFPFFPDKTNKESVRSIEKSIFTVCLDAPMPRVSDDIYRSRVAAQMLHGGGSRWNSGNRWFDKTLQVSKTGAIRVLSFTGEGYPRAGCSCHLLWRQVYANGFGPFPTKW